VSDWISVKDHKPEWDGIKDYEHVRVYAPGFEAYDYFVDGWMRNQVDALFDGAKFYFNGDPIPGVSHWMPLPAAPGREKP
jgi:hypothetical protein